MSIFSLQIFFFLDKSDIGYKLSVFMNPLYEIL